MSASRLGSAAFLACALAGAIACGTEPTPTVARLVTGTVTDSLGTPLRQVVVLAVIWQGTDSVAGGFATANGAGVYAIFWETPPPADYDSLTVIATRAECRPYSSVRLIRAATQLEGLSGDSIDIPIRLGLATTAPAVIAGTSRCAVGHQPFGDATSDFLLQLAIESVRPGVNLEAGPGDSVFGRYRVAFRETRFHLEGSVAGVVAGDTLDLMLGVDPPVYTDCAPGYRLRVALDGRRMGDGFLETLNPTAPQCPVEPLDALRFVPM